MVEVTILARSLRPFRSKAGSIPLHKVLYVTSFLQPLEGALGIKSVGVGRGAEPFVLRQLL